MKHLNNIWLNDNYVINSVGKNECLQESYKQAQLYLTEMGMT